MKHTTVNSASTSPSSPPSTPPPVVLNDGRRVRETVYDFLDRWPRLTNLVKCQLLFFALTVVSFLMGYGISKLEGPSELERNDLYMMTYYMTNQLPLEPTKDNLVELPATCLVQFETKKLQNQQPAIANGSGDSNSTKTTPSIDQVNADLDYLRIENIYFRSLNTTMKDFTEFANLTFGNRSEFGGSNNYSSFYLHNDVINETALNDTDDYSKQELFGYAEACQRIASELAFSLLDFAQQLSRSEVQHESISDGLTFNWIRCWDNSLYGEADVFFPVSNAQRNATLVKNQKAHFVDAWNTNRVQLYDSLVAKSECDSISLQADENITALDLQGSSNTTGFRDLQYQCHWEATKKAVLGATGVKGCVTNSASATWFWFTVMTTVGYGNSAPNTVFSRWMVYCLGWVMLIAFGAVMVKHSYIMTAFTNDIAERLKLKWLLKPLYTTPIWFAVSIGYIAVVASVARMYWNFYVPDNAYTIGDSYWFSYISLLTVGLGDFYIQPQGLFSCDVLFGMTLLMYGFILITTFLGTFTELVKSWLPEPKEPLEYKLARTTLLFGINTPVCKSLEILRELAAARRDTSRRSSFAGRQDGARTPDGNTINFNRIKILNEKKALLIQLLNDNQSELEDRMALENNFFKDPLESIPA